MAEPEAMDRPPELHGTTIDAEGYAMGEVEMLDRYLKCTAEYMEGVQKLLPPKFNTKQCEYLADKLKVVVGSASSFLEVFRIEHHGPSSSMDVARQIKTFKLMLVRAKEIESFILGCSKDKWIQAAMTLTNVSEYVASIGFDLELCRVVFCKDLGAAGCSGLLTLEKVNAIYDAEVSIVKEKAFVDGDTLFMKVLCDLTQKPLGADDKELAAHLLQRLLKVEAVSPCVASDTSWYTVVNDILLENLFRWVSSRPVRIGRGASAVVEKAEWLGKPVAKKTFQGTDIQYFEKEVENLAKLSHPNITSMFCCQKDKRSCSILMELMDGDLHDLMHERCGQSESPPFTIFEAVDIMLEIGEGVNYLHQERVIHRDLKSGNILVKSVLATQSDFKVVYVRTKVNDFGLSKTKSVSTCSTISANIGTSRWMPPEVIDLDGKRKVNSSRELRHPFKVDVYSFAMLCYEILTGYVPFHLEADLKRVKKKVLKRERPDLPADCPLMLKALIEECWDQTPWKRPDFPTICKKLKYVKYLLMAGLSANEDPHRTAGSTDVDVEDAKHFVYVSHSEAEEPFAEQLCKDLEATVHHLRVLDSRAIRSRDRALSRSAVEYLGLRSPLGEDWRQTFIAEAAKKCKVALVVLSEEYIFSEWPMAELVEFVRAKEDGNRNLILIPLFHTAFKIDISEYGERYQTKFRGHDEYERAYKELRAFSGLTRSGVGRSEVKYRDAIVEGVVWYDRIYEEASSQMASSCALHSQEVISSYLMVEPEYKIYLSYVGDDGVENFVEQLDKDLEVLNETVFFDKRPNCLPLGLPWRPLVNSALQKSRIAVVVLSVEYLESPRRRMNELVELVHAMKDVNKSLILIPLYFKITVADLDECSIQDRWTPRWKDEVAKYPGSGDVEKWAAAVQELRSIPHGINFEWFRNSEVKYRDAIVEVIRSELLRL